MENIQEKFSELKRILTESRVHQKEIFTVEDLSEYLQISVSAVYKLTHNREVLFYKPSGKKIYFKKSDIDAWLEKGIVQTESALTDDVESYLREANKISQV